MRTQKIYFCARVWQKILFWCVYVWWAKIFWQNKKWNLVYQFAWWCEKWYFRDEWYALWWENFFTALGARVQSRPNRFSGKIGTFSHRQRRDDDCGRAFAYFRENGAISRPTDFLFAGEFYFRSRMGTRWLRARDGLCFWWKITEKNRSDIYRDGGINPLSVRSYWENLALGYQGWKNDLRKIKKLPWRGFLFFYTLLKQCWDHNKNSIWIIINHSSSE